MKPRSRLLESILLAAAAGLVVGLVISSMQKPRFAIGILVELTVLVTLAFAGRAAFRRTRRARRRLDDAARRALRTVRWRIRCIDPVVRHYALRTVAVVAVACSVAFVGHSFLTNLRRYLGGNVTCTLGHNAPEWEAAHRIREAWREHQTLKTFAAESPRRAGGAN